MGNLFWCWLAINEFLNLMYEISFYFIFGMLFCCVDNLHLFTFFSTFKKNSYTLLRGSSVVHVQIFSNPSLKHRFVFVDFFLLWVACIALFWSPLTFFSMVPKLLILSSKIFVSHLYFSSLEIPIVFHFSSHFIQGVFLILNTVSLSYNPWMSLIFLCFVIIMGLLT